MDNNTLAPVALNPTPAPVQKPTSTNKLPFILLGILTALATGALGYYLGKSGIPGASSIITPPTEQTACTLEAKICPDGSSVGRTGPNCEFAACPVITDSQTTTWRTTNLMGAYTFEYPSGWHAASQWPENIEQGIYVWLDPEPISGAPRGGPFSAIDIAEISGVPNSAEIYNQKLEMYRKDYINVKEEVIQSDLGPIYHFTGTLPDGYMGGSILEAYLLRIDKENDDLNDKIIVVSTFNQEKYAEILKHIALSIKKLY